MATNTTFSRIGADFRLYWYPILALVLLNAAVAAADPEPRLGTLVGVTADALVVSLESKTGAEIQRIPRSGATAGVDWRPGMPVRVWPATSAVDAARVTPTGTAGQRGSDLTGVRRRLNRDVLGGRGATGGGRAGGGGGRGGR